MSTPQTPEPTDEQRAVAAELLQCEKADDDFPYCDRHGGSWPCVNIDAVARALAAAVQQERDKVLAVAGELDELAERASKLSNDFPFEYGIQITAEDAACRIREVSR